MAQVIGPRVRGRKKEALRLAVTEMASKLAAPGKPAPITVEVNPPKTPKGKGESVTFEIPKGSVVVPLELTRSKKEANAREQIRLGLSDAGIAARIASTGVLTDDGEEIAIFHVVLK
jgi:hypothetical protein